jgi:hypothetical protein
MLPNGAVGDIAQLIHHVLRNNHLGVVVVGEFDNALMNNTSSVQLPGL